MAGDVDFGHDADMPRGRIGHDVAYLLLRIEAAVAGVPLTRPGVGQLALSATPAADFRQLGIRLDLDAEAVVVAKVPVEQVEFVHRHEVDEPLDELRAEEVPRIVQHEPPPAEARLIDDLAAGDFPLDATLHGAGKDLHRQKLLQRLDAVEHAGGRGATDFDVFRSDPQSVAFFASNARNRPLVRDQNKSTVARRKDAGRAPGMDPVTGVEHGGQQFALLFASAVGIDFRG